MKKLLVGLLLAYGFSAAADNYQCPESLTCYSDGSHTICSGAGSGWEIYKQLPTTATLPQTYPLATVQWDQNSSLFNNVACSYYTSVSALNKVAIDRTDDAPVVTPDISDLWGWAWTREDKSTAQCNSPYACLMNEVSKGR